MGQNAYNMAQARGYRAINKSKRSRTSEDVEDIKTLRGLFGEEAVHDTKRAINQRLRKNHMKGKLYE